MSATAGTVWFAMTLLIAFLYGAILWHREGWMDRTDDDVQELKREVGLLLGRERSRDAYVPEGLDAPRAMTPPSLEPDDDTDEIPAYPATVPDMKVASSVGPLPVVDADWETRRAQIEAEWRKRAAEIGGGL